MKIVVCSGGFDPLHSGHLFYFQAARSLGDKLIVGLNSDEWLIRKKGKYFMPLSERRAIVSSLKDVDVTLTFDDSDDTAIELLQQIKKKYHDAKIIFANGGDRTASNIPEMQVSDIKFVFGVGGNNKINSSSEILDAYTSIKTQRSWGYYKILHEASGIKVKELVIEPMQSLSMQKHNHRSEYWFVAEGMAQVDTEISSLQVRARDEIVKIPVGRWHKLSNPTDTICKIIEIQYGYECSEQDIERT